MYEWKEEKKWNLEEAGKWLQESVWDSTENECFLSEKRYTFRKNRYSP